MEQYLPYVLKYFIFKSRSWQCLIANKVGHDETQSMIHSWDAMHTKAKRYAIRYREVCQDHGVMAKD